MITYLKMKYFEWKVKKMFYGTIVAFLNNQDEILSLLKNLYTVLKDVPAEKLQKEFVNKFAEIIHNENKDKAE